MNEKSSCPVLRGRDSGNTALLLDHLEDANLIQAQLEGANLIEARLEGADLFQAHLGRADLRAARLGRTHLSDVLLGDKRRIGPRLADVQWAEESQMVTSDRLSGGSSSKPSIGCSPTGTRAQ